MVRLFSIRKRCYILHRSVDDIIALGNVSLCGGCWAGGELVDGVRKFCLECVSCVGWTFLRPVRSSKRANCGVKGTRKLHYDSANVAFGHMNVSVLLFLWEMCTACES